MMFVFIKNIISKSVLDDYKDNTPKCARPGCGYGASLLIRIFKKNTHSTRASTTVAKIELLKAETKSFIHKIKDVNKVVNEKQRNSIRRR